MILYDDLIYVMSDLYCIILWHGIVVLSMEHENGLKWAPV